MEDKEIAELINGIIDYWERDTINLSGIDTLHPAFSLVRKIADKEWHKDLVITTILERMEKEPTWFFIIFSYIIPKEDHPEIEQYSKGVLSKITNIWFKWGREKGYIK
jgi:hypothetical protein